MLRVLACSFVLTALIGCQTSAPLATDRNSVIANAEINTSAKLLSPYGAGLKGSGGGVVTVDGRILKIKMKYFEDDYFYVSVTPSVLNQPEQPLRLDKHSNWRIFLPDLRALSVSPEGFNTVEDITDSFEAFRLIHGERARCYPRDLFTPSPLANDPLRQAFMDSVKYSTKADALAFVGKCIPVASET